MNKYKGFIKLRNLEFGSLKSRGDIAASLGQKGVNLKLFLDDFNKITAEQKGIIGNAAVLFYEGSKIKIIPKRISIFNLLKEKLKLSKGCSKPALEAKIKCPMSIIEEIAEIKQFDMTAHTKDTVIKSIIGTAKSAGIEVI